MKPLTVLIAGGTGFVGKALVAARLKRGDNVVVVGRSNVKMKKYFSHDVTLLTWSDLDKEQLLKCDIVINLAGANIGEKRWSQKQKAIIISSRIQTTKRLATYCAELGQKAPRLFNASAIGIYGLQPLHHPSTERLVDETQAVSNKVIDTFVAQVATQWEAVTHIAKVHNVPIVNLRFGVVLSQTGGMLKKLWPFYRFGLGQIIGSGEQVLTWVSLEDAINSIDFLIQHPAITGAINIVSPHCITQAQFANTVAHYLHRPCWLRLPNGFVKRLFGQMGSELLLQGQAVYPKRLLENNYTFLTPTINDLF